MLRKIRILVEIICQLFGKAIVIPPTITPVVGNRNCKKSKFSIRLEQILFFLKWHEINRQYFLYDFQNKTKEEEAAYIPYPLFRRMRNKVNLQPYKFIANAESFNYIALLRDKFYFGQLVSSLGFSTPKNIAIIHGASNSYFDLITKRESELSNLINNEIDGYCKIAIGECGKGVFHLHISAGNIFIDSKPIAYEDFCELIGKATFIIQETITQHILLSRLYSKSVNTMRVVTCIGHDGNIHLLGAVLRVGAHGNVVDNWAQGGLVLPIDHQGRLGAIARYEFPYNGKLTETVHPDSNQIFEGYQIPHYEEAVNSAIKLHKLFYGIGSIGWDIALTENGPCFIEGNDNHEISLLQVVMGGLQKEWDDIYKY